MDQPVARPAAWRLLAVAVVGTTLATAAVALAWAPLAALAPALPRAGGRPALDTTPPAQLLAGCAAVVLVVTTLWLWTAGLVSLLRLTAGRGAVRAPGVPAAVHRTVLAACGLAAAGLVVAAPAGAVPTPVHDEPRVVPLRAQPAAASPAAPTAAAAWPVRRGDTLWAVAETTLARAGTRPSDAQVVRRVRELHRLNRTAVPDPDLIHPGQLLRLPPA